MTADEIIEAIEGLSPKETSKLENWLYIRHMERRQQKIEEEIKNGTYFKPKADEPPGELYI